MRRPAAVVPTAAPKLGVTATPALLVFEGLAAAELAEAATLEAEPRIEEMALLAGAVAELIAEDKEAATELVEAWACERVELAPAWIEDNAPLAEAEICDAEAESEFTEVVEACSVVLWP